MTRGRFITLEGIDGAGKSSHLDVLCEHIRARHGEPVVTREPGGTAAGEALRALVLHHAMEPLAEALCMFAGRSEHLRAVIEPALAAGRWVVCDRFSDSTYAYQCGGRGLETARFDALEALVHPALQPDATFLFDLDPVIACDRQRAQGRSPDKFERESEAFFTRVRNAYLERSRRDPARFEVIDASGAPEAVRARLAGAIRSRFP
jgi:dTMP kinase